MKSIAGLALVLAGLMLSPGCNECDFSGQRCAGNVLETCGGVDQQIGRVVTQTPCTGLNPVCVQSGEVATCAISAERTCIGPQVNRCEGETLIECKAPGFEVATSCPSIDTHTPSGWVPAGFHCHAIKPGEAMCS